MLTGVELLVVLCQSILLQLKGPLQFRLSTVFKETAQMRWLGRSEANRVMPHRAPSTATPFLLLPPQIPYALHSLQRGSKPLCREGGRPKRKGSLSSRWLQTGRLMRKSQVQRTRADHCTKPNTQNFLLIQDQEVPATLAGSTTPSLHKSWKWLQAYPIVTDN